MHSPEKIRNLAIIAHIDHGKTTLLDGLLKQAKVFRDNQHIPERVMDSNDQEKERGITIFSKHTSIFYGDYKLNLIDTPGHADFSAEVERVLGMVNSVLLIVDALEGPMPQTRFVLSKALKLGLKPIVVLNKIDRPNAEPDRVLNETFDLFVELGANDEQLDFKHCLASAISGYAKKDMEDPSEDFRPLLDLMVSATPIPEGDINAPFLIQAATITYDDYFGRQASGRILQGTIKKGKQVVHIDRTGKETKTVITRVEGHQGLQKVELEEAGVGDIVSLAGIPEVMIGDTICDPSKVTPLPLIIIDEPTISVDVMVSNSPFVGQSGKNVTMNKIRERLEKEKRANISYRIVSDDSDNQKITISGRGELHLAILFETMRREGFEFSISKPQVIYKEIDGVKHEPIQKVYVEVPEEYSGTIIDQLSRKKGEMQHLNTDPQGITHIEFLIPTRGIMGYRNNFLTSTRGLGIMTSMYHNYQPFKGVIETRSQGALISMCGGKTNGYACFNLEERGDLFCEPGDPVYEGMIVGEHNRDNDLVVNITKGKQLTNVRASGSDESIILRPPLKFNIEEAIGYIKDDELVEVTPDVIRLRKRYLTEAERTKVSRKK